MKDRNIFKKTLEDKGGAFYKFYENGTLLRYGYENKYFFECNVLKSENRKYFSISNQIQEFIIVYLDSFTYLEGKVEFDATVQPIDGENQKYVIFLLTKKLNISGFKNLNIENILEKYLEQIIQHEMNHFRTDSLLADFSGETLKFVSEILADSLLILENDDNEDFIKIKKTDVENLVNSIDDGYYKTYLKVVKKILDSDNRKKIATLVIQFFKTIEVQEYNIEIIKEKLLDKITNP